MSVEAECLWKQQSLLRDPEELSCNGGITGGGVDILDEEATPSDLLLIWCQFCHLRVGQL